MDLQHAVGGLEKSLGWQQIQLQQIAGDGSDRKFFRLSACDSHETLILMLGAGELSKAQESNAQWVTVGQYLQEVGLRVPRVKLVLPALGAVVMEDFGDVTLAERFQQQMHNGADFSVVEDLYSQAFVSIGKMLAAPIRHGSWLEGVAFDSAKFRWELDFFRTHYVKSLAGITLSSREEHLLEKDIAALADYLVAQPLRGVHRDFHSRNLMVCSNGELGIIDFQDMRRGPLPYDLVSLCFDAYVPLSYQQRVSLLQSGIATICQQERSIDPKLFSTAIWKPMLLQRQLKAMGSFAYLSQVKNKKDFLRYIAPASDCLGDLYNERWPYLSGPFIEQYVQPSAKTVGVRR